MKTASTTPGSAPRQRAALTRLSLWCFVLSLVGLIPGVGLPFAVAAVRLSGRAKKLSADWNPADRYLHAARRIAPLSLLTTALGLIVACVIFPALWQDATTCPTGGG